jgi:uncharacterized membrane protein
MMTISSRTEEAAQKIFKQHFGSETEERVNIDLFVNLVDQVIKEISMDGVFEEDTGLPGVRDA